MDAIQLTSIDTIFGNTFYSMCCSFFYCKKVEIMNNTPVIVYYICCFKSNQYIICSDS